MIQSYENQREAEVCFRRAIDVARGQKSTSLELRAVMSEVVCGNANASGRKPAKF